MKDIVIEYRWNSKTSYDKSYAMYVNMTKKIFWAYKQTMFSPEKHLKVLNNRDCLSYLVVLKDKLSFMGLIGALRKTDFEEI